jgi:hypothetical protein
MVLRARNLQELAEVLAVHTSPRSRFSSRAMSLGTVSAKRMALLKTIMKTTITIGAAILLTGVAAAQAQNQATTTYQPASTYPGNTPMNMGSWFASDPNDIYRAYELSLDAFASVAGEGDGHDFYHGDYRHRDARGGGGGGLEYFFSRYAGIEVESFAMGNRSDTMSAVGGNLVLRWPIGETGFAPYIFGGGGDEFTYRTEGYGDGGAGLEYRFTHDLGIFGDGRFVDPAHSRNYGMGRVGVRFTF